MDEDIVCQGSVDHAGDVSALKVLPVSTTQSFLISGATDGSVQCVELLRSSAADQDKVVLVPRDCSSWKSIAKGRISGIDVESQTGKIIAASEDGSVQLLSLIEQQVIQTIGNVTHLMRGISTF